MIILLSQSIRLHNTSKILVKMYILQCTRCVSIVNFTISETTNLDCKYHVVSDGQTWKH